MNRTARFGFVAVWLAVAVTALGLHLFWTANADFLGIVETRTHKLGAREAGRVKEVRVALGDTVDANQALAVLDTTDLDTERDWLVRELKDRQGSLDADRVRYGLEYERLKLQGDASQAGLVERHALVEARKAELATLNVEIERLAAAERAGLGRSRDLADLEVRRDSAARFLRDVAAGIGSASSSGRAPTRAGTSNADDVIRSLLGSRLDRIRELELRLKEIEGRMERRSIVAPCAGRVVEVKALPGDTVEGFASILTVEEPAAAYIDVYIPETSDFQPRLGQRVRIHPHRTGAMVTGGTVAFIDPGYSAIPQRLAVRNILYWARKFRVRLDADHGLMPGEAAKVEMLDGDADGARLAVQQKVGS